MKRRALECGSMAALAVMLAVGVVRADPPSNRGRHWAFQGLVRPPLPTVKSAASVRAPVDAFLLAKLEAKGLGFSDPADAAVLLRRLSFDLTGLPPTPGDIDRFVSEAAAKPQTAYEALVDRLLASPHFGERWGRHWLDNAGYSDVTGGDNDAGIIRLSEGRWKYRDWVVRAFSADMPFAQFLRLQLAGDETVDWRTAKEFTPAILDPLIATGFLRLAADDTEENELNTLDIRHGVLQRTLEAVSSNLLGLTLNCAKCHDHKYEPISQEDYYALQALLQPAFNPQSWLQPTKRQLADVPPRVREEMEKHNLGLDKQLAELKKRQAGLGKEKEHEAARAAVEKEMAALERQRRRWGPVQAVYDVGPPTPTHRLHRGSFDQPRNEVPPGFLAVLGGGEQTLAFSKNPAFSGATGTSSGRRLALARWLTDDQSRAADLVLRVRVNRIWQHLFGRGLVESSDNLGVTGTPPTHPELLDWLAAEFRAGGGRLKPFVKTLVMSSAYRQSSVAGSLREPQLADPDNRLLGRMRLRRLESEAVRDAMLAAAGKLDLRMGGAPVPVESRPDGTFVVKAAGTDGSRRSLYLLARRNYHPTLLGVFDQPNLTTNCAARSTSAVVLQTLTMLNDAVVLEQARGLGERVSREASGEPARIERAFRLTLSRAPSPQDSAASAALLQRQRAFSKSQGQTGAQAEQQALVHLCHMLLNTSEFLYVP